MGLTSGERYSTGRLAPQKRGIHCACQHFMSERVGVLAECDGVGGRLPLGLHSHSAPLPFPAQFACALFLLDFAGNGAKSVPTGKNQAKVAAKKTRKKPGGPCLRKCWAELHGWSFTQSCFWGWTLAQNQASLDWASSVLCRVFHLGAQRFTPLHLFKCSFHCPTLIVTDRWRLPPTKAHETNKEIFKKTHVVS